MNREMDAEIRKPRFGDYVKIEHKNYGGDNAFLYYNIITALRRKPLRALHRIYARLFGYFWLPCPICRRHFGGNEVKRTNAALIVNSGRALIVCSDPACSRIAELRNAMRLREQWLGLR